MRTNRRGRGRKSTASFDSFILQSPESIGSGTFRDGGARSPCGNLGRDARPSSGEQKNTHLSSMAPNSPGHALAWTIADRPSRGPDTIAPRSQGSAVLHGQRRKGQGLRFAAVTGICSGWQRRGAYRAP